MPGYVIHLATANEYIRKHKDEIKNKEEFLLGAIEPDFIGKEGKRETHFGESSSRVKLREFLKAKDIDTDHNKGYFLHLVTDYIFYNKIISTISKDIYNDYDILNKHLMEKYKVKISDNIKDSVFFKEGETKILTKELAEKTIDETSELNLEKIKEEILSVVYTEKWDKIRELKRLD